MSISAVSGSSLVALNATPSTNIKSAGRHAPAAQPATSKSSSTSATGASPSTGAAAAMKSAVTAVVNEATETGAQTIKEAMSGDHTAQKLLHMDPASKGSTTGRIINTKA
jgi:hypothetical protein